MRQLRTLFPGIKRPGGVVIGTWKDTDKQNVVLFPLFSALQPEPSVEFRRWVDSTERVSRRCAGDARYLYRIPPHESSCDAMSLVISTSSAPTPPVFFNPSRAMSSRWSLSNLSRRPTVLTTFITTWACDGGKQMLCMTKSNLAFRGAHVIVILEYRRRPRNCYTGRCI